MIDYWDDGASVVNRTNSSVRGDSDYMREREESSRVGGRTSEYESRYDIDKWLCDSLWNGINSGRVDELRMFAVLIRIIIVVGSRIGIFGSIFAMIYRE